MSVSYTHLDVYKRQWKSRVTLGIQLIKSICMGSLLYADDIVLIQENEDDLQRAKFQFQDVARFRLLKYSFFEVL